jgi:hypothetical protein
MTEPSNKDEELQEEDSEQDGEGQKVPPVAQKISRFGPQSGSKFGK